MMGHFWFSANLWQVQILKLSYKVWVAYRQSCSCRYPVFKIWKLNTSWPWFISFPIQNWLTFSKSHRGMVIFWKNFLENQICRPFITNLHTLKLSLLRSSPKGHSIQDAKKKHCISCLRLKKLKTCSARGLGLTPNHEKVEYLQPPKLATFPKNYLQENILILTYTSILTLPW